MFVSTYGMLVIFQFGLVINQSVINQSSIITFLHFAHHAIGKIDRVDTAPKQFYP